MLPEVNEMTTNPEESNQSKHILNKDNEPDIEIELRRKDERPNRKIEQKRDIEMGCLAKSSTNSYESDESFDRAIVQGKEVDRLNQFVKGQAKNSSSGLSLSSSSSSSLLRTDSSYLHERSFNRLESQFLRSIMMTSKHDVKSIMVPIEKVFSISSDLCIDFEALIKVIKAGYSRIVIVSPDGQSSNPQILNVRGYLHIMQIVRRAYEHIIKISENLHCLKSFLPPSFKRITLEYPINQDNPILKQNINEKSLLNKKERSSDLDMNSVTTLNSQMQENSSKPLIENYDGDVDQNAFRFKKSSKDTNHSKYPSSEKDKIVQCSLGRLNYPIIVSPNCSVIELLHLFKKYPRQISVISPSPKKVREAWLENKPLSFEEGSNILGIVTLEDVLEFILQHELYDEIDEAMRQIQP